MEISYRAAVMDDLEDIFRLVECAVKQIFRNDIKNKSLYIGVIHDKIVVVCALNEQCDEQYKNGQWQYGLMYSAKIRMH